MKQTLKTVIGALTLSALASSASAQVAGDTSYTDRTPSVQAKADEQTRKNATDNSETGGAVLVGAMKSADLIGMDVVDRQGEKLGSVREIAVDVETGRIVQVILSTGGFLGIGASETALPPRALALDAKNESLQLDADKERLESAPSFDTSKWSESFTTERLAAQYKHFGLESSFDFVDESDQPTRPFVISESRLDGIQRASEIVGMEVANLQNEAVGEVEEILFDLSAGRVLALVVTTGEYLGIENELSAIPASVFRFSTDRETLQIDTNKAALGAAPHFKSDRWPDFTQADTAGAIYAAHSVEPHFRSGTASNPRLPGTETQTANQPATQGSSSEDMATTSAIQKEIRALENISVNARNVKVVTTEGHTTLSGTVDTAEEKQLIGEIADRNNQDATVNNLLEVKSKITTTQLE